MTEDLPPTDTIDPAQLRRLLTEDPDTRVLDVRTGGEFESVHIPGSYNVPLDTLGEHAHDLADVAHPVVLVCQSGGRASRAHQTLTAAGKDTLHILRGGIVAWEASGGDVVRDTAGRWAMDRQVRFVAGLLVLIAVMASTWLSGLAWVAAAVGAGLAYSALTNTCAMAVVLGKLPYNRSDRCDIEGVLAELNHQAA
jgi:rhodanese-related sulfurtransferase